MTERWFSPERFLTARTIMRNAALADSVTLQELLGPCKRRDIAAARRVAVAKLFAADFLIVEIASLLNRVPSAISNELARAYREKQSVLRADAGLEQDGDGNKRGGKHERTT